MTPSCGGQEPDPAIKRIGLAAYAAQIPTIGVAYVVTGVNTRPIQLIGYLIEVVLLGPLLVEGVALLVNLAVRPGQLLLGRRRKQLAGPPRSCWS